ncbi:helix-turn-helix domain-containing protein [Croceitalea rosinachiae]|uniref:Helix-turn-helix transcriptional regulator n=1 Tax=Croceitalea rosinachiae TaxID=3075596 RepID=A0ABU3ADF0_9FLAO|nr:helix-turn-helix transcriptional regulator [Croceitalea sp. F388]MDT0607138.1 helix-turn-helix transcriptional regulator [Croceitalea sp. F388]
MNVSGELLFFFSALGVFNALLISFYFFFFKKPKNSSNFFLGFLLLMLAIRVGKSVFYYFNPELAQIFIKFGLAACILIGPSLYFYIKSIAHTDIISGFWIVHFLVLTVLSILIGFLFPETHNPCIISDITWIAIIYKIWLGYIIASGWLIRSSINKVFRKNEKLSGLDFWMLSIFMGNFIIWIAYTTISYTSYIVGALSFSFIFYLLFLLIYFRKTKGAIFDKSLKYSNKKIEAAEAQNLSKQLSNLMEREKMYTDSNLKLSDVANKMNILPHTLSQFINDNLGKSFTLLINEYRVQEAKNLIRFNTNTKLEAIGYDCGFNSKSTFYSAFKKITNTTPAKFKESNS